jgi:D-glycero-D-manno-heptose 1,7-bisphosphate phosphatase
MLLRAAVEHRIDLAASYVVGDKYSDVGMAHRAGARGVLVLTGYGRGEREYQSAAWPRRPDFVAENLLEAVEWILADAGEAGRGA